MRRLAIIVGLGLAALAAWYATWYFSMAPQVKRIESSIAHHYQALRAGGAAMSLRADAIYAAGFPFDGHLVVENTTLSLVEGEETFAVSIPKLRLELADAGLGTYRVQLPATVKALYAVNGQPPEHYTVSADTLPKLNLSAQDGKTRCGPLSGQRCADVAADTPLISFALGLPRTITLRMTLGEESRDARFDMIPIDVPVYQPIPGDLRRPLQLFVGVLREALVFKSGDPR
jgi:hypothetical protein